MLTVGLVVLAVGLRIGAFIYRQHVAVREIERVGGSVSTDPRGPEWLRDPRVDHRFPFDIPHWVSLGRSAATDATLIHVGRLTELKMLQLDGTPMSDAGLMHLKGLTGLRKIWLQNTRVTDAGAAALKSTLPRLEIELAPSESPRMKMEK